MTGNDLGTLGLTIAMQQTRWEILQTLKRSGGSTIEELARAHSLAPMTVRQHLGVLERDGLMAISLRRNGPGRPARLYALSASGEELFPKGYHRLAQRLLQELALLCPEDITGLTEQEKIALVFHRIAEKQAHEMAGPVQGATLDERGMQVTALLRDREGTTSEWVHDAEGYLIEDYNCPFHSVAISEPELCNWHVELLTSVLKSPVDMETCIANGDGCCRFRIQQDAGPPPVPELLQPTVLTRNGLPQPNQ